MSLKAISALNKPRLGVVKFRESLSRTATGLRVFTSTSIGKLEDALRGAGNRILFDAGVTVDQMRAPAK